MKIVALAASLVSLVAIAVVLALRSSAGDGQSELRISRADGKLEAVVDAQGHLHVPSTYRAAYEFLVRCGKSDENDLDQLQNGLSLLSRARPSDGLGL